MHPSGIVVKNLWKSFGQTPVLKGISLDIQPGESVVILGPSGCGKSVFLKCILGLLPYEKGHISIDGHAIGQETPPQQNERFSKSGVVFQSSALLDSYTILENIIFRERFSNTGTKNRDRGLELLSKVGLDPQIGDLMPSEISGGMKRRVALARALFNHPTLIFFDEPTEGLDPISADEIAILIRQCIKNATALTISHTLRSAKDIADRVVVFDEGVIAWQGSPQEMKDSPCVLVQKFIEASKFE